MHALRAPAPWSGHRFQLIFSMPPSLGLPIRIHALRLNHLHWTSNKSSSCSGTSSFLTSNHPFTALLTPLLAAAGLPHPFTFLFFSFFLKKWAPFLKPLQDPFLGPWFSAARVTFGRPKNVIVVLIKPLMLFLFVFWEEMRHHTFPLIPPYPSS